MDVEIDGSHGEGGGQILRSAIALSLLTGKSFQIRNIRAGRKVPGLKAQHATVLRAVSRISKSTYSGADVGSSQLSFGPAPARGAQSTIDVGTAGSITLILQAILPVIVFAPGSSSLTLVGGTDVSHSMPLDYLRNVILPPVRGCAKELSLDVEARGFFPKGGGRVRVDVESRWTGSWAEVRDAARAEIRPMNLIDRGKLRQIHLHAVCGEALEDRRVAERLAVGAGQSLSSYDVPIHSIIEYGPSRNPGCSITAVAEFEGGAKLGGSALGSRGKPAETVGCEAAVELSKEIDSGAPVDEHAADNLIIWLALLGGTFRCSRISEHTRTNIWLVEQFLGPIFRVEGTTVSLK